MPIVLGFLQVANVSVLYQGSIPWFEEEREPIVYPGREHKPSDVRKEWSESKNGHDRIGMPKNKKTKEKAKDCGALGGIIPHPWRSEVIKRTKCYRKSVH